MKLKFDWGTGTIMIILLFFLSIGIRIYISSKNKVDLVSSDYYPKEIEHQTHIEKEKNTNALVQKPVFILQQKEIVLIFPLEISVTSPKGEIYLYRPSDLNKDIHIKLALDSLGQQKIPRNILQKGKYILKLDWNSNGTDYYLEQAFFIP